MMAAAFNQTPPPAGQPPRLHHFKAMGHRYSSAAFAKRKLLLKLVKIALVAFALVIVAVVLWIANVTDNGRFNLSAASVDVSGEKPEMVKPRFQGIDAENRPFTVTADRALQQDGDNVELTVLQGDMTLNDGSWVTVMAAQGSLNSKAKMLFMRGDVQLYHDSGVEFRTPSAMVDMDAGTIEGREPVQGQSDMGTLEANLFQIWTKEKVAHFEGQVKVVLFMQGGA